MTEPLTDKERNELAAALEAARGELETSLQASQDSVQPVSLDEPIGRLTRMDALQQQSMAKATRRTAEARLRQLSAALAALDEGDYGSCAACEEPIGYPRLKARPETRLCLPCQEERENRR
jgi:DnaK suppressor protein